MNDLNSGLEELKLQLNKLHENKDDCNKKLADLQAQRFTVGTIFGREHESIEQRINDSKIQWHHRPRVLYTSYTNKEVNASVILCLRSTRFKIYLFYYFFLFALSSCSITLIYSSFHFMFFNNYTFTNLRAVLVSLSLEGPLGRFLGFTSPSAMRDFNNLVNSILARFSTSYLVHNAQDRAKLQAIFKYALRFLTNSFDFSLQDVLLSQCVLYIAKFARALSQISLRSSIVRPNTK